MGPDDALRRYKTEKFTDADVTYSAVLSVRAWRELIKLGAVSTIKTGRGRGRIRTCDAATLKRAVILRALNHAGLSLKVAAQVLTFMPIDNRYFDEIDPLLVQFVASGGIDPLTKFYQPLAEPRADWFDPTKAARAEPDNDWLIEIADGRFVAVRHGVAGEPAIFGDLRNDGSDFVHWFTLDAYWETRDPGEPGEAEMGAPWHQRIADWTKQVSAEGKTDALKDHRFEDHSGDSDPLARAARNSFCNPVSKISVNLSLAVKKALRRYLKIDESQDLASARISHEQE
jgi:hypothetical protein